MSAFSKAIRHSLRYPFTIFGAFVCSLLVAVIWSASITTVFPLVKIVLEKETAKTWVQNEIDDGHRIINALEKEIAESQSDEMDLAGSELANLTSKKERLAAERESLEWFQWVNPAVQKYAPDTPFQTLVYALIGLLTITFIKGGLLVVGAILDARVAEKTVFDLRRIYYRKALELDQRRIDGFGASNMMTHLSYNMTMISSGLRMFYGKCLREPLKMISSLAVAAYISLPLLMISLIIVPAGLFIIHSVSRRMKRATESEMEGMADVFQTLIETFKAVKTVRIFNRERSERRRFKGNAATLYRMQIRIALYDSLLRPITEVLSIISISISILIGAWLVLNQETHLFGFIKISDKPIEPAMLLLFYSMLAGAADPARKMSEIVNCIVRGGTACDNLFRTFDVEGRVRPPAKPIPVPKHQQSIEFDDVTFAYLPRQAVVKSIKLQVPFKETVAIVGGNGSGKSTLMHLLARFYDPHIGRILVDGKDIKLMHPKKVRQQIAWVTQESVLFQGTVWENVAYGAPNATEEQILNALKLARVDEFVDELPDGYQTKVGDDGKNLSAGQRQRVAIARAMLADPRILILDEATSQIDGHSESLIHEAIYDFIKNRTTFIVTHRQSSLQLADRVIVMELGRIVHDNTVEAARESSEHFQSLFLKSA